MGCGAISGQNKMALNVLKTHVGSVTKVTGILNAIVHSHSSSTCDGALYARSLSSQVELQNEVITAGILTLGKPRSSSFTLLVWIFLLSDPSAVFFFFGTQQSHTERANSNITAHSHHSATTDADGIWGLQPSSGSDLGTSFNMVRISVSTLGYFFQYQAIASSAFLSHTFLLPSSHSSVQNNGWLQWSSQAVASEWPLKVSANPRYSGFSAVGVTNPFICLGTTPSVSSPANSFTPEAPAPVLALARWSR